MRSNLEEEAISKIKRDPVTVDSRLALLLASGKVPSEFSLVPNDRALNAKLIETCGISSSLRHEQIEISEDNPQTSQADNAVMIKQHNRVCCLKFFSNMCSMNYRQQALYSGGPNHATTSTDFLTVLRVLRARS